MKGHAEWKISSYYTEDFLAEVNPFWLQFDPPSSFDHTWPGVVYLFIFVAGLVCNTVAFYGLMRLRTPSNFLVLNLTVIDILSLLNILIVVYNSFLQGPALGNVGCQVFGYLFSCTAFASMLTFDTIAIDRYLVVCHNKKLTKLQSFLMLSFVWCYSGLVPFLPLLKIGRYAPYGNLNICSFDFMDESSRNLNLGSATLSLAFVLSFCIIVFCYSTIRKTVKEIHKGVHLQRQRSDKDSSTDVQKHHYRTEVSLAYRIFGKLLVWFLAWTPFIVVAVSCFLGFKSVIGPKLIMLPSMIYWTATIVNPFIYALSRPDVKQKIFRCELLSRRNKDSLQSGTKLDPPTEWV